MASQRFLAHSNPQNGEWSGLKTLGLSQDGVSLMLDHGQYEHAQLLCNSDTNIILKIEFEIYDVYILAQFWKNFNQHVDKAI